MKFSWKITILFIAYLVLRLVFIWTFPPFTDESTYIRWGQLMIDNPFFRWASLQYVSRQPLSFWLFGIGAIITGNPLIGGRLTVLLANIPVFFLLYTVTEKIWSRRAAYLSLGILTFTPLFILTQSLALMDGFLFALSALLLWIVLSSWSGTSWKAAVAMGAVIGIGLWIKTTALYFAVLSTFALVWKLSSQKRSVGTIGVAFCIMATTVLIIASPLFFQEHIKNILNEPSSFTFTPTELIHFPAAVWVKNALSTIVALTLYMNPLVLVVTIYAVFKTKQHKGDIVLFCWFLFPYIITIIVGKDILVRYFIIGTVACIPLLGLTLSQYIDRAPGRFSEPFVWIIISVYSVFFIYSPVMFFRLFPVFSEEPRYALSWPSGYGIPELVNWIDQAVPPGKQILLAVADSPGNPSDYLLAYYYFKPSVRVIFATLTSAKEFQQLQPVTQKMPLYLATRSTLLNPNISPYLIPIKLFNKPYSSETVGIYRVSF